MAPDLVVENLTPQEDKSSIENNGMHIAHQRQVNNPAQIIEMRSRQEITSTEHEEKYEFYKTHFYDYQNRIKNENSQDTIKKYEYPKFEDNEHNEDNGRKEQNDDQIEEIVQLPNVAQAVYTVISENKKKNRATDKDKGKEVHAKKQDRENIKKTHASQPDVEKEKNKEARQRK